MGASGWPGSVALRLLPAFVLGAALLGALLPAPATAQAAHINLGAVYQFEDPAGDVAVEEDDVVGQLPLGDPSFDDVDLVKVYVYEDLGPAGDRAPTLVILLEPAGPGDGTANYTVSFALEPGPTSLPSSNASGQTFTFTAVGSGQARPSVSVPVSQLGAVGGDLITGLRAAAARTDLGTLPVPQDDKTGRDEAPDAGTEAPPYTVFRAPQPSILELQVVSLAGTAGNAATVDDASEPVEVGLRIRNLGLDADAWQLSMSSEPPLQDPPGFAQAFTPIPPDGEATTEVPISLTGMEPGTIELRFTLTSERGGTASATATLVLAAGPAPPPGEREVKPEGLAFLTGAAEAVGFDGLFEEFAEAALLALIVLLVILAIFLLAALGRSHLAGEPAPVAPWPKAVPATAPAALAGPGGMLETVRASTPLAATPAASGGADDSDLGGIDAAALAAALGESEAGAPAEEELLELEELPLPPEAAAASAASALPPRIRIEEVRHTPREPEAGEGVTTEVILRNDGASASLRMVLSVDGRQAVERSVTVPSRATKAVELPWTAGPGDNRVKVQAFPL